MSDQPYVREDGTIDTSNLEWLEEMKEFTRYATEGEESIWVCNLCEAEVDDPYEEGCLSCGNGVQR